MITYQVTLPAPPSAIVGVEVKPVKRHTRWHLGGEVPNQTFRVSLRYMLNDGCVRTHRGLVQAAVAPDRALRVMAWQVNTAVVTITLMPAARRRERPFCRCRLDRFSLPLDIHCAGIRALTRVEARWSAAAIGQGDALMVRGAVTIRCSGPGTEVAVRIPFGRLLASSGAGDLRWRILGGVAGIHLAVEPGGQIRGEIQMAVVYQGFPHSSGADDRGRIQQVREITAAVAGAEAESLGNDLVLVQGSVEMDVYWVDSGGRSRWTGRTVPFSGIARLPGVQEGDRLEVQARVQRVRPAPAYSPGMALLLVTATVTHLRPGQVNLADGCYRVEQMLRETTLSMQQTVQWAEPAWITGGPWEQTQRMPEVVSPDLWRQLSVTVTAGTGPGDRWRLQARLSADPFRATDSPGGWFRNGAAEGSLPAGAGGCALVLADLRHVGPDGTCTRLMMVPVVSDPEHRPLQRVEVGRIEGPGAVRWILGIRGEGGGGSRVQVLVAGSGGVRLIERKIADLPGSDRPGALMVYCQPGDNWEMVIVAEY